MQSLKEKNAIFYPFSAVTKPKIYSLVSDNHEIETHYLNFTTHLTVHTTSTTIDTKPILNFIFQFDSFRRLTAEKRPLASGNKKITHIITEANVRVSNWT